MEISTSMKNAISRRDVLQWALLAAAGTQLRTAAALGIAGIGGGTSPVNRSRTPPSGSSNDVCGKMEDILHRRTRVTQGMAIHP